MFYSRGMQYSDELGSTGVAHFALNSTIDTVVESRIVKETYLGSFPTSMALSPDRTKLLTVLSKYYNSSRGALWEIDVNTGSHRIILDSTANVVSARYLPDGVGIIYYTRSDAGLNDGYYYHNLVTSADSLVLSRTHLPTYSFALGFDIRPDGRKLIFSAEAASQYPPPPSKIVEYDLLTHTMDTLSFSIGRGVQVWLRYNHSGTKMLYCSQYPGDGTYPPESKIGILELATHAETPLNVRTDSSPVTWVLAYNPEWNWDDSKILFIGGYGSGEGNGYLTLWVLTRF